MNATVMRQRGLVVRHFVSTRAVEVLALQASPALGIVLGGYRIQQHGVVAPLVLMLGSIALTAHIFVFNDWAGHASDLRDRLRAPNVFSRRGISREEVAWLAGLLLLLATLAFALLGRLAVLCGVAIAALGFLYSLSSLLGKSTPVASSLNHLTGGTLHFLLGYTLMHPPDVKGVCLGLFFGLVFAAGHLNQEVRDYEGDALNGIRTNAVAFGRRRAFVASLITFTAAYTLLTALAAFDMLPRLLVWSPLAWLLQLRWTMQALRRGLDFETAEWMQRRYRWLFALIGLVMLSGTISRWLAPA